MTAPEVDPAAVETLAELLHETVRDFHGGLSWGELGDFAKGEYRMRATAAYPLLREGIAAEVLAAQVDAWDEGWRVGRSDGKRQMIDYAHPRSPNPYRALSTAKEATKHE